MMKILAILLTVLFFSGCAIKQPGKRTFTYGPDGATITSETTEGESKSLADIEKEKTRQTCYKQSKADLKELLQAAQGNPIILAMIRQTDALNNAVTLAVTHKAYDPCPSSTNSSDVEIADDAMYSGIYHEAAEVLKVGVVGAVVNSSVGKIAKVLTGTGGATTVNNTGAGSISMADSLNSPKVGNLGNGNDMGGTLTRTTTTAEGGSDVNNAHIPTATETHTTTTTVNSGNTTAAETDPEKQG